MTQKTGICNRPVQKNKKNTSTRPRQLAASTVTIHAMPLLFLLLSLHKIRPSPIAPRRRSNREARCTGANASNARGGQFKPPRSCRSVCNGVGSAAAYHLRVAWPATLDKSVGRLRRCHTWGRGATPRLRARRPWTRHGSAPRAPTSSGGLRKRAPAPAHRPCLGSPPPTAEGRFFALNTKSAKKVRRSAIHGPLCLPLSFSASRGAAAASL